MNIYTQSKLYIYKTNHLNALNIPRAPESKISKSNIASSKDSKRARGFFPKWNRLYICYQLKDTVLSLKLG